MATNEYKINCTKTVFKLLNKDFITHCNPTGKYRFYESGEMTIEFEIKYTRKSFFGNILYTKKAFVNEAFITFPLTYAEFDSNAD